MGTYSSETFSQVLSKGKQHVAHQIFGPPFFMAEMGCTDKISTLKLLNLIVQLTYVMIDGNAT